MNDPSELHVQIQYPLFEQLSASEKRYSRLMGVLREGILVCDAHGNLLTASNNARNLLDVGAGQLPRIESVLCEESGEDWRRLLKQAEQDGRAEVLLRVARSAGERVLDAHAFRSDEAIYISIFDVTEREKAREAEHRSNAMLAMLARLQTLFIEKRSRHDFADQFLSELLNWSGCTLCALVDVPTEKEYQPLNLVRTAGHVPGPEHQVRAAILHHLCAGVGTAPQMVSLPDGRPLYVASLCAGGEVLAVLALADRKEGFTDSWRESLFPVLTTSASLIAAYRKEFLKARMNEQALMEKGRYQQAMDLAGAGLWEWNPEERQLLSTSALLKVIGRNVAPPDWSRVLHPDDLSELSRSFLECQAGGIPFKLEVRLVDDGDQTRWLEAHGGRSETTGRILGFVIDITARKVAEEALRDATKLAQSASQARTEFLANVSHEIRTPLHAVLAAVELLRDTSLTPNQHRLIDLLGRSGENLLSLINDLLDLSKIDSGNLELVNEEFDVSELVTEAADLVAIPILDKGLEFVVDHAPSLPMRFWGDRGRLRQVLVNLLGNASKFTQQGSICLRIDQPLPGQIRFSVADTGIGIPEQHLSHIFDRFSQVDASSTRAKGGVGLGLAISQELMRKMGSTIEVESHPGEGSVFSFTLPQAMGPAPGPLGQGMVLVLEERPLTRRSVAAHLEAVGFTVRGTSNFMEALRVIGEVGAEKLHRLFLGRLPESEERMFLTTAAVWRNLRIVRLVEPSRRVDEADVVRLPVTRPRLHRLFEGTAGGERAQSVVLSGTPLRVLAAEDHEDNQLVLRSFFATTPHHLEIVSNGAEALALLARERFDLILMDMQMPILDGYQATPLIRKQEAESGRPRTRIIAMTAHASSGEIARTLEVGCDAHASKPISRDALCRLIGQKMSDPTPSLSAELAVILPKFLERTRTAIEVACENLAREDFSQALVASHQLAGTGATLGRADLGKMGREMEAACKAGKTETALSLARAILQAI